PTETLPGELVDRVQSALKQGDVTAVRHLLDEWERTRAISGKPAEPDQQELFLSATKIETYLTCPLKYRLQFIDQFPEKKSQARMGFGTIIHRVLEQFHSPGSELTEERILTLLDQAWDSRYFEYRIREEEFRRQAETYLKSYVQWVAANPPSRPRPEVKVTFALPDINVKITGKIDRIDQDEEGLRIVDYKTGNPSREPLKKNFQLALYTAAIRRGAIPDLPADQPIRVQLIFVKDLAASEDEYRFSPTELAEQLDRVTQTAAGIRQGNFQPKPSRHHCSYCDYKDFLCPEFESDGS
ncbi:MAG: PD-(D/E)XK nuclease family protein, partial [Candidatus Neomarinimicrobiota bacterium]